jgi:RNA polymerase sigma-70 factor (ECF subfamily)
VDQTAAVGDSADSSISSSLLGRIRLFDPDAWRRLLLLFSPDVYRWARKAGLQPSDASDILQDVFRAVALNVGEFQRERPTDSFRGWLWTIAQNKIRDYYRKKGTIDQATGGTDAQQFLESIPEQHSCPEESNSASRPKGGLSRRILDLISGEFEPQTWNAFWRVTVDGVPAVDVARELGMTAGAVRQAKYRVLRRLRQEADGLTD